MEKVQALNIDVLTGAVNPMPRVSDAGDEHLHVTFAQASHFNDTRTRDEQRPIFEMKDYITIIVPGDSTSIVHRPVRDSDKDRFPRQWLAYQSGREQQIGYPLSEWPMITRAQVDELSYFKITTVETLASVSDTVKQKFLGLRELSEKAKAWLAARKGEEPALALAGEIAKKDEEIGALQSQLAMMQEAIAELQKANSKKGKKAVDVDEAA